MFQYAFIYIHIYIHTYFWTCVPICTSVSIMTYRYEDQTIPTHTSTHVGIVFAHWAKVLLHGDGAAAVGRLDEASAGRVQN